MKLRTRITKGEGMKNLSLPAKTKSLANLNEHQANSDNVNADKSQCNIKRELLSVNTYMLLAEIFQNSLFIEKAINRRLTTQLSNLSAKFDANLEEITIMKGLEV